MRRWPRSPRSASCAPRSSSSRDRNPIRNPNAQRSITKTSDGQSTTWKITLPKLDAAKFDAALQSHRDALIAEWKRDHDDDRRAPNRPPLPGAGDGFMRLVEAGWDADAARRPHGQHTTVVMHLDVKDRVAVAASGPAAHGFRTPLPDLRRHLRSVVPPRRAGHRSRAGDAGDQPPASPCPRASPPHLCGARLRRDSWFARPSHPALGRRRPHRVGQPGAGVSVPPSAASSGRHHHHRTRRPARRHRQRGTTTQRGITRPPTNQTPTGRAALPRTHRRTRRLVVVRTLPTAAAAK